MYSAHLRVCYTSTFAVEIYAGDRRMDVGARPWRSCNLDQYRNVDVTRRKQGREVG